MSRPSRGGGRVGPYELVAELGRGGMGAVYRARGPDGAEVALKVVHAAGDARALARLRREADALARLEHPHVARVLATGEHEGRPWVAMELYPGPSLAEELRRRQRLEPRRAAEVALALARALAHAHARGLLHRDLKPDNVIFDARGAPRLTDFGLTRDLSGEQEKLTRTGTVLGTPGYWAPEQAMGGLEAPIGPPADVYALGATLYACLTGRPPFDGDSHLELLAATVSRTPEPPSRLVAGLDPALEDLCLRCLEKDPGDRPPSAEALADALEGWLAGASAPRRAWPVLLAAAALGAGLLGAAQLVPGFGGAPEAAPEPAPSRAAASPSAGPQPAPSSPVPAVEPSALPPKDQPRNPPRGISIDFDGPAPEVERGSVAAGDARDRWNVWSFKQQGGTPAPLRFVDGASAPATLLVQHGRGDWANEHRNVMFRSYLYNNFYGRTGEDRLRIELRDVPAGRYDLYLYGHGAHDLESGIYEVLLGERSQGIRGTASGSAAWHDGPWEEDRQFVVFRALGLAGEPLVIYALRPALGRVASVSGLQLLPAGSAPPEPRPHPRPQRLWSLDCGPTDRLYRGAAAVGRPGDAWNALPHDARGLALVDSDQTPTSVTAEVRDADLTAPLGGPDGQPLGDALLGDVIALRPDGEARPTVLLRGLPPGRYDVYAYASASLAPGIYELRTSATSHGIRGVSKGGSAPPPWTPGAYYVVFAGVEVRDGALTLTAVRPSAKTFALLAGIQVALRPGDGR
ncbi:MAG: serine/threonine-protein kinase [Planctomycetota bacterium]